VAAIAHKERQTGQWWSEEGRLIVTQKGKGRREEKQRRLTASKLNMICLSRDAIDENIVIGCVGQCG